MYQSGGSERDSDAERMIANEMRILESPNLQYALGLSGDELGYIAYAVKLSRSRIKKAIPTRRNKKIELVQSKWRELIAIRKSYKKVDANIYFFCYNYSKDGVSWKRKKFYLFPALVDI